MGPTLRCMGITRAEAVNGAMADVIVGVLRQRRQTQRQLADESGINFTTLNRLLRGTRRFWFDQLDAIATALDVDPSDLVTRAMIRADEPPLN